MSEKKVIAVVGATGSQGGGLARAILADPASEFAVRALTRDVTSVKAKELAELGAEVVRADVRDEASVVAALSGAHGAYFVTDFWSHGSAEQELADAATLVRAAKAAGVRHAVWSTLEDTREHLPLDGDRTPVLQDRFTVPHFDAKAEADELFRDAGVPTTFLRTTFYWESLINPFTPQRGDDGVLVLSLPMEDGKRLAGIAAQDIGRTALGIFQRGEELVGRTISIAGEHLTGAQIAEKLSAALGEEVRFRSVPFDAYRGLDFPGAEDVGNMFQYYSDFDDVFTGARDLDAVRELNPRLQTFDQWLRANSAAVATIAGS